MADSRPVVEDLAARLSSAIMSGEFPPGTRLRQEALAERYGFSRQPVREALRHVQAQGLVHVEPHRGVLVRRPTPREVRDSYRVRGELEGLAAELAAQRADLEELAGIRAAEEEYWRLVRAHHDQTLSLEACAYERGRANDAFHAAVRGAAGSKVLDDTVHRLMLAVPRGVGRRALSNPRVLEGIALEHQRVREAIESGDGAAARVAITSHIRNSGELIAERYEADDVDQ